VVSTKAIPADSFIEQIGLYFPNRLRPLTLRIAASDSKHASGGSLLENEALRWTYVLRSRERWLTNRSTQEQHEEQARRTLGSFGIGESDLAEIAAAGVVIVRMPFRSEAVGWEGRVFPWEYVLAAATRRHRVLPDGLGRSRITVMRELTGPIRVRIQARPPARFLFVQSAPGELQDRWDFSRERDRLRRAVDNALEFEVIENPTPAELTQRLARSGDLTIVHFSGLSNAQGLRELYNAHPQRGEVRLAGASEPVRIDTLVSDFNRMSDGFVLSSPEDRLPLLMPYHRLPEIFTDARRGAPVDPARPSIFFVSLNIENSSARVAPLLVGAAGALAALGFQDVVADDFSESFFELLYSRLVALHWNLPQAFQEAWTLVRSDPSNFAATGSGIALWGGTHLLPQDFAPRATVATPTPVPAPAEKDTGAVVSALPGDFSVRVKPFDELNYSVLHNKGRMFEYFDLDFAKATPAKATISIDVELHLGTERAAFSRQFPVDRTNWNLASEIHMPLTASLIRSTREAVNSSLVVNVAVDGVQIYRDTHRMRLLPVDQWRDNASDGVWLPSFIQPRDAAVVKAIEDAQRYVRVLRDDPNSGFEGYQAAPVAEEEQMREIDLQVQAIWATLLHDWRLGYINPPPTYSGQLDSQRLRRPTTILESRSGTCIDLALLLASCLELVDIYPVVFLLKGHALPGYWRHDSFHSKFSSVDLDDPRKIISADRTTSTASGAQRVPWRIGGGGYKEVMQHIRKRQLVPIETVRLTENCGFAEAIEAGIEALSVPSDFDSILDIVIARRENVTPLPIAAEEP
jgi:hypothetical protein